MLHHKTRILYTQFKTFGDVIVSTAIVRALKGKYQNSTLDFYTNTENRELLVGNPHIDKIHMPRNAPVFEDYDVIFRPYRCLQMSGGWHLSGRHFMSLYAEICGVELESTKPDFYNIGDLDQLTLDFLKNTVLIQCKTNDSAKDWDRFPELVDLVAKSSLGLRVVQIGGTGDPAVPGVAQDMRGKTSWPQTAAMIKHALTTVCLDSAVQHLAAALEAPYIALYGAKESKLVRSGLPQSQNAVQLVVDPEDRCGCEKACYLAKCFREKKCINTIEPGTVMDLIKFTRANPCQNPSSL